MTKDIVKKYLEKQLIDISSNIESIKKDDEVLLENFKILQELIIEKRIIKRLIKLTEDKNKWN